MYCVLCNVHCIVLDLKLETCVSYVFCLLFQLYALMEQCNIHAFLYFCFISKMETYRLMINEQNADAETEKSIKNARMLYSYMKVESDNFCKATSRDLRHQIISVGHIPGPPGYIMRWAHHASSGLNTERRPPA